MVSDVDSTNPADYQDIGILDAGDLQTFNQLEIVGRYVMIYLAGNSKILSLAEVEILGEEFTELATNKPTQQSTTDWDGSSSRAVDGVIDGVFLNDSVTHTQRKGSTNPWWRVDLGDVYALDTVTVYNRTDDCCTDRLSGAQIWVSNTDTTDISQYQMVGTLSAADVQTIDALNAQGRYVMIRLQGGGKILSLAEVSVVGKAQ